jgi:hypothetical protein
MEPLMNRLDEGRNTIDDEFLLWLRSNDDDKAEYLNRGRWGGAFEDKKLFDEWKNAVRKMLSLSTDREFARLRFKDLSVEILLRNLPPPFAEVQDVVDDAVLVIKEGLRTDPDRATERIMKEFNEFRRSRGRAN